MSDLERPEYFSGKSGMSKAVRLDDFNLLGHYVCEMPLENVGIELDGERLLGSTLRNLGFICW